MENTKYCKVTFYAELSNADRQYMQDFLLADVKANEGLEKVYDLSIVEAGNDRTEELLSNLVDFVSVGRSIGQTIAKLKENGFKDSELERMGYKAEDIANVEDGEEEDW